jgi:hypothetical protein
LRALFLGNLQFVLHWARTGEPAGYLSLHTPRRRRRGSAAIE